MDFKFRRRVDARPNYLNTILIETKADWKNDVANWETKVKEVPITIREYALLKQAHNTETPNIARATKVKSLMQLGYSPLQIYVQLKHLGRGYGPSSIKHDHAALSKR